MRFGIHELEVEYADPREERIRRIRVRFGDDHELEIMDRDGRACLRLAGPAIIVTLQACGPLCQYERALNLLNFYMPDVGEA